MAHDRPDEIAQPGSHDDTLAQAVRAVLLEEGFLTELVERVQARLGSSAAPAAPPNPPASLAGPPPIGPYEISPDFANIRWDLVSPPGEEWSHIGEVRGSGAAPAQDLPPGGPRVGRGSRIGPEPAGD